MPKSVRINFTTLIVLGFGAVVRERVRLAVRESAARLGITRVVYFDTASPGPDPGFDPDLEEFVRIAPGQSALALARRAGLLGRRTLVLVCTPTCTHAHYAREFAPHVGRVGVEKPTCLDPAEAAGLIDCEGVVLPLGHQLFKAEMRAFTAACRRGEVSPGEVAGLRFTLFENKGVGGRTIDPAVWDTGWHGVECSLAPMLALAGEAGVEVGRVRAATYHGGPDLPRTTTAARIDAALVTPGGRLPLTIRVGKGVGLDLKLLEVIGPAGRAVRTVALTEGGHLAHGRMIEELWTRDEPDMQLGLRDVVRVVEACAEADARAEELPAYRYGEVPHWMEVEQPVGVPA